MKASKEQLETLVGILIKNDYKKYQQHHHNADYCYLKTVNQLKKTFQIGVLVYDGRSYSHEEGFPYRISFFMTIGDAGFQGDIERADLVVSAHIDVEKFERLCYKVVQAIMDV